MLKRAPGVLLTMAAALALGGCAALPFAGGDAPAHDDAPSSGFTADSAAICFNPTLGREGTRYQLHFRRILPGVDPLRFTPAQMDFTVEGTDTVDGTEFSVITGTGNLAPDSEDPVPIRQRIESAFDTETPAIRRVRVTTERGGGESGEASTVTERFSPPRLFRFDLAPGESYTQSYQRETVRGGSGDTSSSETREIRATVTFTGLERVRGVSGPVNACRFVEEREYGGDHPPATHTYWIAIGSGLTQEERIRSEDNVRQTYQLLRATIHAAQK